MTRNLPALALLVLVAGLGLGPMQESDLFFRLRAGEEILRAGAIPATNLTSFTYPEHPDLDLAWLFEVVAALLFRAGGFRAVVLGKTVVLVAAFAGALAVCRRRGAGPSASALALAAAALVMRERLSERPHVFSFAGDVAVLAALAVLDGPRPRRAWWLVPATALWANLHAGAFLAPALLGCAALGGLLDGRGAQARHTGLLAAACALATLATPAGLGLPRYLAFHLDINRLHPVDEFRRLTLISDGPLVAYAAALALLLAAAALGLQRSVASSGGNAGAHEAPPLREPPPREPSPLRAALPLRELLPLLALAVLAFRSVRFGADFALLAAPTLAVRASALAARLPALASGVASARAAVACAALLLGLAVGPRLAEARAGRPAVDLDLDEEPIPVEAIRFAEANGLRERMYNDFEIGSFLAWDGYPRYRVFVDPRLPAYPEEFHRLLGDPDLSRAAWDAAIDRFGVDAALLAYAGLNRRVAWWDPSRWALVYRRHDARVFVRRTPRHAALIAAREIPATFTFTVDDGAVTVPLDEPPAGSPVAACEWQRRLGDLLFELDDGRPERALGAYRRALAAGARCLAAADEAALRVWLGALDLTAGRAAEALASFDRALALGTADATLRTNRALALEALGRSADARAEWAHVAALARGTPLGDKARARAGAPAPVAAPAP